jgi:alanyl-tRNA synthetase
LTSKNYRDLKLKLIKIKEEFETNHHHKQKQLTNEEVIKIKLLDKKLIERKRLYMIKSVNHSTDAIKLALTDLSKEDPKHIYILFNEIFNRTQYFIIMSKSLVEELKVSANQIIKEINKLVSGSGGGNDVFAQGGTTQQINYEKLL